MREMRNVRYLVVVIAAFVYFDGGRALSAAPPPPICSEVCDSSTACDETCYENMMEFENGNDITCLEYGVYDTSVACCGDGACVEGEEPCTCNDDCGTCSSGSCNPVTQTGCQPGQKCNMLGVCKDVPNCEDGACDNGTKPSPPECWDAFCESDDDCCGDNICLTPDPGQTGFCVPNTLPF